MVHPVLRTRVLSLHQHLVDVLLAVLAVAEVVLLVPRHLPLLASFALLDDTYDGAFARQLPLGIYRLDTLVNQVVLLLGSFGLRWWLVLQLRRRLVVTSCPRKPRALAPDNSGRLQMMGTERAQPRTVHNQLAHHQRR